MNKDKKDKNRLSNSSRLKETKKTWQQDEICDPRLYPGPWENSYNWWSLNMDYELDNSIASVFTWSWFW